MEEFASRGAGKLGRTKRFAAAIGLSMCCAFPGAQAALVDEPDAKAFISKMAKEHKFSAAEVKQIIAGATVSDRVLKAFATPAERKKWFEYRRIFITNSRIEGGIAFWKTHRTTLERAEREYGVPPEVIVAIVGVETLYGKRAGNIPVLDSLVTLGFRGKRRREFFRNELREFLLLSRDENIDLHTTVGSYAGAMGIPQFISSSYRAYAIDFDGDGQRDLLTNPQDAIGSVANYLSRHGWKRLGIIAVPVKLSGAPPKQTKGLKPNLTVDALRKSGVRVAAEIAGAEKGRLIELTTKSGKDYWVGFQNFYAISRYNPSTLYTMAVFELASAVRTAHQGE